MAYPETCAGALSAIYDMGSLGGLHSIYGYGHTSDAYTHWTLNQDHLAIQDLIKACWDYGHSTGYLAYKYTPFAPEGALYWYITHCIVGYELTMDAILSTMLSADPTQVEYFVGLVDAYRQSIWNRPFDKDFFAALARGFMEWP